jgi:hypothetical protein
LLKNLKPNRSFQTAQHSSVPDDDVAIQDFGVSVKRAFKG